MTANAREAERLIFNGTATKLDRWVAVSFQNSDLSYFVWMMAARREVEDCQSGVVNVQPEFVQSGWGLEASRK